MELKSLCSSKMAAHIRPGPHGEAPEPITDQVMMWGLTIRRELWGVSDILQPNYVYGRKLEYYAYSSCLQMTSGLIF